jgi:hypothetical protein
MEYLTIKESVQLTGKSESSIKRMIKEFKSEGITEKNGYPILKHENLPTKYQKIYIQKKALEDYFRIPNKNKSTSNSNHSKDLNMNSSNNDSGELLKRTLELLENELLKKKSAHRPIVG